MLVNLRADRVQAFPSLGEVAAHGKALMETAAHLVRQSNPSAAVGALKRWRDILSGKTFGHKAAEATRRTLVALAESDPAEFRRQGLQALDLRPRSGLLNLSSDEIHARATTGRVRVVESAPKPAKRKTRLLNMSADEIWAACGGY